MNIGGYELISEWKVSNIGHTALAKRGSKKYFLKRYGEYKMPRRDASISARLYEKMEKEFNSFQNNRIRINRALESLAGPGGNIILPAAWFVDDIYYIEATEFVENLIEDEKILKLPMEDKLFIMLTAAGALHNIHRKNIVHSDLKRSNILAAKNSAGKSVAKIIDFDRSYFADDVRPDELGGDQKFMSPELAMCFICEMSDEALAYLSTKSDIFSLGLVFHNYLVNGEHPKLRGLTGVLKERAEGGGTVYCGEALYSGAQLIVSGKIKEEYLRHLIAAMLQPEPEDRPTAQEVLEALKLKKVLPLKEGAVLIEGESDLSVSPEATPAPAPAPRPAEPVGYCEPWAEHKISFNTEKLAASGYVAAVQCDRKGIKCYELIKRDGSSRVFIRENLVLLGLASKTGEASPAPAPVPAPAEITVSDDGALWEEDGDYKFNVEKVNAGGYKSICRGSKNGKNGYVLTKADGRQVFMSFNNVKMLGFAVKK